MEPSRSRAALTAALVSAIAVAAIAHIATVLAFFIAGGGNSASLVQVSDFFLVATLFAFILLSCSPRWMPTGTGMLAVPAAIVAAILASLLGTLVGLAGTGTAIDATTVGPLFGTVVGPNLVFIVAVTIAAATVGRRIWFALAGNATPPNRAADASRSCAPRPATWPRADHPHRTTDIDADLAEEQWDGYLQALIDNGWEPVEVPPRRTCPILCSSRMPW